MSLQDRTLVVKNFDPERTTSSLLKELFIQGGPIRNVVFKPDHAFVEFEDVESVGYTRALLEGVELFGRKLVVEPKNRSPEHFKFTKIIQDYIRFDKQHRQQIQQQQQMMAYHQQQALQMPYQPIVFSPVDPSLQLQLPNNASHAVNPQICDYNSPFLQNPFASPNQMPSTSVRRNNNDNIRRSRSFNHHGYRETNRPNRGHGWPRQR